MNKTPQFILDRGKSYWAANRRAISDRRKRRYRDRQAARYASIGLRPLHAEIAEAMGWTAHKVKQWEGRNHAPVWSVDCFRLFVQSFYSAGLGRAMNAQRLKRHRTKCPEQQMEYAKKRYLRQRSTGEERRIRMARYADPRKREKMLAANERYRKRQMALGKWNKRMSAYCKRREAVDLNFKLGRRLRSRVYLAIKLQGGVRMARCAQLVGCSIATLILHLESKFESWMTWENYGKAWEIDHRRPCASFDLTDALQQIECFHFSNLQPLSGVANRSKGAKWQPSRV